MTTTLYQIPAEIYAGFKTAWTLKSSEYPASEYIIKYTLKKLGSAPITLIGTADGNDHLFVISSTASADYEAGTYYYQCYVEDSGGELFPISTGKTEVKATLLGQSDAFDPRTHAQKCLEAIEAVIEGRATSNQSSVKVGTKELRYYSFTELLGLRAYYINEVESESGEESGHADKAIYAKFTNK